MSDVMTRNYQGYDDALAIAQLRARCAAADGYDPLSIINTLPSADAIHETAAQAGGVNWRIALLNGEIAGYANVGSSWTEIDGTSVCLHDGHVDPGARGHGLGTAGLRWAEERIARNTGSLADEESSVFGTSAGAHESARTDLLRENGYEVAFSTAEMELDDLADITDAPIPVGVTVSDARPRDIHAVWELNEDVYADRPFTQATSGFDAERFRTASGSDLSLWTLAWDRERLVGFVISRAGTSPAAITEVSVRADYRRRGLASALLLSNLERLRQRGQVVVRLHTNGEDVAGARSLYTKLGFKTVQTFVRYRKRRAISDGDGVAPRSETVSRAGA